MLDMFAISISPVSEVFLHVLTWCSIHIKHSLNEICIIQDPTDTVDV